MYTQTQSDVVNRFETLVFLFFVFVYYTRVPGGGGGDGNGGVCDKTALNNVFVIIFYTFTRVWGSIPVRKSGRREKSRINDDSTKTHNALMAITSYVR